jgi:hypothetical protein
MIQSFRLLAIAMFVTALLIPAACGEEDDPASSDAKTSESQPQSETSETAEPDASSSSGEEASSEGAEYETGAEDAPPPDPAAEEALQGNAEGDGGYSEGETSLQTGKNGDGG